MSQITRCPFCATTFKVVADQLRVSEGWVRCGQCKEVFDASEHLLLGEREGLVSELPLHDERAPTQTAMRTPQSVNVWASARDSTTAPVAHDEPLPPSDGADQPAQCSAAAGGDEDCLASVSAPEGDNPVLASWLKREAPPEPQDDTEPATPEMPGYELPGASHSDSTWPQDVLDDALNEPVQDAAAHDAPQQEQATEQPGAWDVERETSKSDSLLEVSDEPAEQLSVLQRLESLSYEPIAAEEAVVLPPEALLDEARTDAAVSVAEPGFVTAARRSAFWRRSWVRAALAVVGLCLMLVLGLQVAVQERDAIAARSPAVHALMEQLCQILQCTLQAPREIDAVVIDSSSFVKARHDAGAYQLEIGIKNTSAHTVAMPALELTLTDTHEQPVLRRVLLRDELGAPLELAPGTTWNATVPVQVTQDASRVAGYRLLAFYP